MEVNETNAESICYYVYIADYHNIALKFDYTQADIDSCSNYLDQDTIIWANGKDELWKLGAAEFMITLMEDITIS